MSKKEKIVILSLSLAAYLASLTQTAFTANDFDGEVAYSSISVLSMGVFAVLGGGLSEWIVWLANPLYVFGAILLYRDDAGKSMGCSMAAAALAMSFAAWKEILAAENGRMAEIERLNAGYWLWLAGLAVLTTGAVYGFVKQMKQMKAVKSAAR